MSCTRVYLQWRFGRSFKSRWQYWWRTTSSANETWTKSLYRFRVNCTCTYPVVNDRWGATDVASLPFHFILFSASLTASQNCNPVHSAKLFSQHFFCRSLLLPPCTVPYKIVLASPDDLDTCPNVHFNLRFFTVVKISSYGPMAWLILSLTASLVMWSLYEMPSSFVKHIISVSCNH